MTSDSPGLDLNRVLPIFVLVFVDVLGLTVILPLLHLYAATYGATPLEIGLVAAAFPLAQLIGVPVMGSLSDRFGRKPLLIISQITTFVSFVMLGLAGSLQIVLLSRVIDGLFGANLATAQAALTDITDEANRTQGLGLTGAAFGLGFVFGPLIAAISLEFTDTLAIPAFIAATYSLTSLLITIFVFRETLPPESRNQTTSGVTPFVVMQVLRRPQIGILLILMFAQQVVFFGFETLLGLFTLSRLGLLGQGNAYIFLYVGILLVTVQVRFIGRWSRRFGDRNLILIALGLLSLGLLLTAFTPDQPHPFYVRERVERDLIEQAPSETEAIIGEIGITLPQNKNRGVFGVLWMMVAITPVAIGSGLIRPGLNSLMTKCVQPDEYGRILGVSSAFVSAANATAPLIGGLLFQSGGAVLPFLVGGLMMGVLSLLSMWVIRPALPADLS